MILRKALAALMFGAVTLIGAGDASAQRKGGDVVIAIVQAPPSLDAQVTSAQAARNINLHMFETLYARDENAKPVPELAEGVKISDDGMTYVFPIRKGVKFHNGKELDAKDVVASLERYRKVGASRALLAAIDKVEASGPNEVTVTSEGRRSRPSSRTSRRRARRSRSIRRGGRQRPQTRSTSSAPGPFQFVEYKPDSHVKIARYDGYVPNPQGNGRDGFAGKKEVFIDTVTFRFMPEAGARNAALEAGEVHLNETGRRPDGQAARRRQALRGLQGAAVRPAGDQVQPCAGAGRTT